MLQYVKMYGSIVLAMVFWSFSFIWTQVAMESFEPVTLVTLRLVFASLLLFLFAKITGKVQKIKKEDYKWFFLLALFEPYLYYMGETYGLQYMSATTASVIIATIPLFAPVLAFFMLKERITWTNILGIIVSISGVILVIYVPGSGMEAEFRGVFLMFMAVFAAVFYTATLRRISMHYHTINVILYQSLIGLVFFVPTFFVTDFSQISQLKISWKSLEALIMLSIFASVLAFVLFAWVVRKIGIAKTNVFVNLIPVFTAIFSWLLLKQFLSFTQWTGIVIVVAGLFVSQLGKRKKQSVKVEEITRATEF